MPEYIVKVRVVEDYLTIVEADNKDKAAKKAEDTCFQYSIPQWQSTEAISVELFIED